MATRITLEAPSVASLVRQIVELDHETRAVITATENGRPWAMLDLSPATDTQRSVFPLDAAGVRGDTRRRSHAGVMFSRSNARDALSLVIERARRMGRA